MKTREIHTVEAFFQMRISVTESIQILRHIFVPTNKLLSIYLHNNMTQNRRNIYSDRDSLRFKKSGISSCMFVCLFWKI